MHTQRMRRGLCRTGNMRDLSRRVLAKLCVLYIWQHATRTMRTHPAKATMHHIAPRKGLFTIGNTCDSDHTSFGRPCALYVPTDSARRVHRVECMVARRVHTLIIQHIHNHVDTFYLAMCYKTIFCHYKSLLLLHNISVLSHRIH